MQEKNRVYTLNIHARDDFIFKKNIGVNTSLFSIQGVLEVKDEAVLSESPNIMELKRLL